MLDVEKYCLERGDEDPSERFIIFINHFLKNKKMDILELASGPGNLTKNLLNKLNNIENYISSDISPEFLYYQSKNVNNNNINYNLIQFDANNIPFNNETFDVVLGSSCLHHFLYYENTLKECYRILKPGGLAIFTEPIRTGNAVLNLMLNMMVEIDILSINPKWNKNLHTRIKAFANGANKILNIERQDRSKLTEYEDKYQFSLEKLKKLSKSIGFTDCKSISDIKDNYFDNNLSLEFFKSILENHMNHFIPGWKFEPRFENTIKLIYNNLVYPFIGEDHCCMFTGFCMVK
jgi:ubiquinone/menaquinone biosynthesis C-methylase UbiE